MLPSDLRCGAQAVICYLRLEVCTTWAGAAGRHLSTQSLMRDKLKPQLSQYIPWCDSEQGLPLAQLSAENWGSHFFSSHLDYFFLILLFLFNKTKIFITTLSNEKANLLIY